MARDRGKTKPDSKSKIRNKKTKRKIIRNLQKGTQRQIRGR